MVKINWLIYSSIKPLNGLNSVKCVKLRLETHVTWINVLLLYYYYYGLEF